MSEKRSAEKISLSIYFLIIIIFSYAAPACAEDNAISELPDYHAPESSPAIVTPQKEKSDSVLSPHLFVRQFRFDGNTVFSDEELRKLSAPYENREITFEELEELRRQLTLHYVEKGYINSGAVIQEQKIEDNTVVFQIIEGQLSDIKVTNNKRIRERYIRSRLLPGAEPPLNMNRLQERVYLLHKDPIIRRLDAELSPGTRLGESVLNVRVEEERAYLLEFQFANNRSPSVGALRGEIHAAYRNLTGWGDTIGVHYGLAGGLDDISVYYTVPLTARDTVLKFRYERSGSTVIEEPFKDIDIESESETYGITLTHPLLKKPEKEFSLSLTGERRHSETYLLGNPFSFSEGVQDGESDVAVIRFSQDWVSRSQTYVVAARSLFSFGIDAMGATHNESGPDGRFFSWIGQFQWAKRLEFLKGSQMIFRTDMQFSKDPLLPLEKFSVGGAGSVRGYRENQMVRDNGVVSSLEFRVPVFRVPVPKISRSTDDGTVNLAIFADWGWAENTDLATPDPRSISGAGPGIRWDPSSKIHAQIYWGISFRDVDNLHNDIQDSGVHFQLGWQF